MKNPRMLYKTPGKHEIHGGHFDYIIVDEDDEYAVKSALESGWHLSTTDALDHHAPLKEAKESDDAARVRADLEATATELGIKFRKNISTDGLVQLIQDKTNGV